MKYEKIHFIIIIFLLITLLCLTGCSNNDVTNEEKSEEKTSITDKEEDNKILIRLNGTADFIEGIATVNETIQFETTNYVIDENFNVLTTYQNNYGYIGRYQIRQNEDKSYKIVDSTGKEVFTYGEYEYENVELLGNDCVFLKKKTDTYNSSVTVGGIYDLAQEKYVLEPSEKYLNLYNKGDNMYIIDGMDHTFFNTKSKKLVTFANWSGRDFIDGYSVDNEYNSSEDCYYLCIWDDNGGFKKIKAVRGVSGIHKCHSNGMLFYSDMEVYHNEQGSESIRMHSALYNLETGEVYSFGTEEYNMPTNSCKFTKEGYGLLTFNNQGGTPYYTILDKKGNKLFEPIKVNDNAAFQPDDNGEKRIIRQTELYDGNYLIVEEDGVDTVLDINNKVVLVAEEYEVFEGMTNGVVKVKRVQPGYYDEYYYKDLKGNKIQIYK